jgi:hypothetical protein
MNLVPEIEKVFAWRTIPNEVVSPQAFLQRDSDIEDTLWFVGRNWHAISWNDWQEHDVAMTYFTGEAFAYYLPSVLALSAGRPEKCLSAAERLISHLDLPPDVEYWNPLFQRHFLNLSSEECEVVKQWLLIISDSLTYHLHGTSGQEDNLGRAFDTMNLLQQEIERWQQEDGATP